MVLNGESTHPNPWRTPTEFEKLFNVYHPYKIDKSYVGKIVPSPNFFKDTPFATKCYIGAKKGLVTGVAIAWYDYKIITKLANPNERLARALFVGAPYSFAAVALMANHEFTSRTLEARGWGKDHILSYTTAGIGPAAVIYGFTRIWSLAHIILHATAFVGTGYKIFSDIGGTTSFQPHWIERGGNRMYSLIYTGAFSEKGATFHDKYDDGPAWKKWQDAEDKK